MCVCVYEEEQGYEKVLQGVYTYIYTLLDQTSYLGVLEGAGDKELRCQVLSGSHHSSGGSISC